MATRYSTRGAISGSIRQNPKFFVVCFLLFVAVLIGICFASQARFQNEISLIEAQKAAVSADINAEYAKQLDAKASNLYYGSDAYYEALARGRFNLIKEGDHVYVFHE